MNRALCRFVKVLYQKLNNSFEVDDIALSNCGWPRLDPEVLGFNPVSNLKPVSRIPVQTNMTDLFLPEKSSSFELERGLNLKH